MSGRPMRLLAMDTSTPRIVAGVLRIEVGVPRLLAQSTATGATAHAERLAPAVRAALAEASLRPADLDGIVVGLGPGPFTGLRVGVMTAAAMADALGIPVWGVLSLAAVEADLTGAVVVSDARRKEIYYVRHDGEALGAPAVGRPADVVEALRHDAPSRVIRAGAAQYDELLRDVGVPVIEAYPSPAGLLRAALADGVVGGASTELRPVYLRRPDAAEPKPLAPLAVVLPDGAGMGPDGARVPPEGAGMSPEGARVLPEGAEMSAEGVGASPERSGEGEW